MKYFVEDYFSGIGHHYIDSPEKIEDFIIKDSQRFRETIDLDANNSQDALRKHFDLFEDSELYITETTCTDANTVVVNKENLKIMYYKVALRSQHTKTVYFYVTINDSLDSSVFYAFKRLKNFSLDKVKQELLKELYIQATPPSYEYRIFQTSFLEFLNIVKENTDSVSCLAKCKCIATVYNENCIFGLLTFNRSKNKIVKFELLKDVDVTIEDLNDKFANHLIQNREYYLVILTKTGVKKLKTMLEIGNRDSDFIQWLNTEVEQDISIDYWWH